MKLSANVARPQPPDLLIYPPDLLQVSGSWVNRMADNPGVAVLDSVRRTGLSSGQHENRP